MLLPPFVGLMLCSIEISRTRCGTKLPGLEYQFCHYQLHDLGYFSVPQGFVIFFFFSSNVKVKQHFSFQDFFKDQMKLSLYIFSTEFTKIKNLTIFFYYIALTKNKENNERGKSTPILIFNRIFEGKLISFWIHIK